MKQIRKRLTYANVMSSIAVFLMLGGGAAIAAKTVLPKNSVGAKQLKKNAVKTAKIGKEAVTTAKIKKEAITGAKVKSLSLTGTQVDVSQLGTVPLAARATIADSLPAPELHLVGAPGQPPFLGGSINFPSEGPFGFPQVSFYKDHDGTVHLEGIALVGEALPLPGAIFQLPAGFRPASGKIQIFDAAEKTTALVIGSDVNIEGMDLSGLVLSGAGKPAVLSGITFLAQS